MCHCPGCLGTWPALANQDGATTSDLSREQYGLGEFEGCNRVLEKGLEALPWLYSNSAKDNVLP